MRLIPSKAVHAYWVLILYGLIAFALRNHQLFVDEGTNLNLATALLGGSRLYRDVFHNHMPLDAMMAAVLTLLLGRSLPLIRLVMILITGGTFFWLMRATRFKFAIGFMSVLWALIGPYYFSSLLLYDNITALCGLVLLVLAYAVHADGMKTSRELLVGMIVAGAAGCLATPFFSLTAFVATASLWFAPQIPRRFVLSIWLGIAGCMVLFCVYLLLTGSTMPFYQQVIVFNATTYQRYAPLNLGHALLLQLGFLHIWSPEWLRSAAIVRKLANSAGVFDQWIFSGFFFRAAALLSCSLLLLRRKWMVAVFVYLFLLTLALRSEQGFHAGPFVVVCLFLAGLCIEESFAVPRYRPAVFLLCGIPAVIVAIHGIQYLIEHAFRSDFGPTVEVARRLRLAAQNRDDVQLGSYPSGSYMNFLTGLQPASRFVDYYPWIVDIGRPDMDRDLEKAANQQRLVLSLDLEHDVWGRANTETLRSVVQFARKRMVKEAIDGTLVYVSPGLASPAYAAAGAQASRWRAGIYRGGVWLQDTSGDHLHSKTITFGHAGEIPVVGDWDGSGTTKVGIYRPRTGEWVLDYNGNGVFDPQDRVYIFGGSPGDIPVVGDWDGSGFSKIGIFRSGFFWLLDMNGNGRFDAGDAAFPFGGINGDIPVVGDWNGSGTTNIGVFRKGFLWILDTNGNHKVDPNDTVFAFGGIPGDVPVVGDWGGTGKAQAGIVRQGFYWILDVNGTRKLDTGDAEFAFGGISGDVPVGGKW